MRDQTSLLDWMEAAGRHAADVPVAELAKVPTTVRVDGVRLTVEVRLWQDSTPEVVVRYPDGRRRPSISGLTADVRIGARAVLAGVLPVPAGLTVDRVAVIVGQEAWVAGLAGGEPSPDALVAFAADGPEWAPGATADVVLRLRDPAGHRLLVRVPGERITHVS